MSQVACPGLLKRKTNIGINDKNICKMFPSFVERMPSNKIS